MCRGRRRGTTNARPQMEWAERRLQKFILLCIVSKIQGVYYYYYAVLLLKGRRVHVHAVYRTTRYFTNYVYKDPSLSTASVQQLQVISQYWFSTAYLILCSVFETNLKVFTDPLSDRNLGFLVIFQSLNSLCELVIVRHFCLALNIEIIAKFSILWSK